MNCSLKLLKPKNPSSYKNIVGNWSAILDIIYTNQSRGVQRFDHLYNFLEPDFVNHNETFILGRVRRLTTPRSHQIIFESAGEGEDTGGVYEGFYNNHLYALVWNPYTCVYDGQMVDVDDTTFNKFTFDGTNYMESLSYEVSQSKDYIDNAHLSQTRFYKMSTAYPLPTYQEIYESKKNNSIKLTPTMYSQQNNFRIQWEIPKNQKDKKDLIY